MAFEIESNGRMGFDTGNEGIRRGGTVGAGFEAIEDIWHAKGLPDGREIEPDDLARRVGILENTGSVFSLESTPELLPSEDCEPSSDVDEEDMAELRPYDMAQLGSACDDVGVVGEYPEDDELSESDLDNRLEGISVESGERQGEDEAM